MVQGGMKLGAPGLGHTMDRPYPPLVCEGAVVSRMPVPRGDIEACGATHERVERRNHPITLRDRQGAAWTEIVLHVHHDDRIATRIELIHRVSPLLSKLAMGGRKCQGGERSPAGGDILRRRNDSTEC